MDVTTAAHRLDDANGHPLVFGESVWLTVLFGNTLYRVISTVADRRALEVLIGATFQNRHLIAILCTKQKIRFRYGDVTIFKQLTGGSETDLAPFAVGNGTEMATRHIDGEESLERRKSKRTAALRIG